MAGLRLCGVFADAGLGLSFCGSSCGSSLRGSIRATCQTPEICRRTTPPAEISRAITHTLRRAALGWTLRLRPGQAYEGARPHTTYPHLVSGRPELLSLFLDSAPSTFHMTSLSVGLADAKSQREFVVELGVGEIEIATLVQTFH